MSIDVAIHNVRDITVRAESNDASEFGGGPFGVLRITAVGPGDIALKTVLFGESADAMRSMLRSALAVDYADKVSDAVIAAFKTYSSHLHGKTPEDEHPCEACLDALQQDVVNAVTEALR